MFAFIYKHFFELFNFIAASAEKNVQGQQKTQDKKKTIKIANVNLFAKCLF